MAVLCSVFQLFKLFFISDYFVSDLVIVSRLSVICHYNCSFIEQPQYSLQRTSETKRSEP